MKGKTPSTTSSAEAISYNDDLLLGILILLPAKSLIRFKSVNKHWRSLISDASFRHLHTRRHQRPQNSFLLRVSSSKVYHLNPTSKNFVPLDFEFPRGDILQSCNGLLLVHCGFPNRDYCVFNPTTGESRNLLLPDYNFSSLFLAFDPWKSPHYKVFCLRFYSPWFVYDSETHNWNLNEKLYFAHPPLWEGVYSHNFIYSLSFNERILYRFDIEKLILEIISEPRPNAFCIMDSFGRLHLFAYDRVMNHLVVDEMTADNGDISFNHLFHLDIAPWSPEISFLGIMRGDRKDDSLVFHIPGKVMAYRFHERSFEELLDCTTQGFHMDGWLQFTYKNSCQFVESLAPV